MSAVFSVALNGFREARRNRISVIVALFAIGLLATSTLVTNVTVYTLERVLTDFGLGTMSLALVMLAIFLSGSLLAREVERRTIFLMVTKPISRPVFLLARFLGNMITLGAILLGMGALFVIEVYISGFSIHLPQLTAIGMLFFEVLVVSSVGFAMSSNSSQMVSAVVTTGVYIAGHLSPDIYTLSSHSHSGLVRAIGKVTYYVLPNLDRLNFRPYAAYGQLVAISQVASAIGYALAYAAVMLSIAALIFSRRDFR
jgi:Cu-processing system permease protein